MSFSLYAATVPSYLQILGAFVGILDKVEPYCAENSIDPADLLQARLADDMFPLAAQIKSIAVHSQVAIESVRKGVFSPDMTPPPATFAGLKELLVNAIASLEAVDPAEVDGFVGGDTAFVFGDRRIDFVSEDFLLTFSQPNFYFHATTAYDILRWKGLPIGKRDFLGNMRMKPVTA